MSRVILRYTSQPSSQILEDNGDVLHLFITVFMLHQVLVAKVDILNGLECRVFLILLNRLDK
jgi:hypothetical protein